jgi:hypothetical protein
MTMWTVLLATALQVTPIATCRSVGLDTPRTWQFDKTGATWSVTHWRGKVMMDATRVALPPTASVQLTRAAVSVKARTSNGGIDVSLSGTPAEARLDVYVSYELEVNVDTSLTPAIDDLNTEGPIGVRCEVTEGEL